MKILTVLFVLVFNGLFGQSQEQKDAAKLPAMSIEQITKKYEQLLWVKNDWPGLNRYREENQKLRLAGKNENRVVFIGNSITDFWVRDSPDFFKGKPYIGRGISGQTTPQMLARFRADVVHLHPKAVVILAGINDLAGNTGPSTLEMIEDNLASMAEIADANGIRVVLSSVLPVYEFKYKPEFKPAEKIIPLNKWIKEYSVKNGHIYLDYFSSMVDSLNGLMKEYSDDGLHPNKAGYKVMEPLVEKAIEQSLNKKQTR